MLEVSINFGAGQMSAKTRTGESILIAIRSINNEQNAFSASVPDFTYLNSSAHQIHAEFGLVGRIIEFFRDDAGCLVKDLILGLMYGLQLAQSLF